MNQYEIDKLVGDIQDYLNNVDDSVEVDKESPLRDSVLSENAELKRCRIGDEIQALSGIGNDAVVLTHGHESTATSGVQIDILGIVSRRQSNGAVVVVDGFLILTQLVPSNGPQGVAQRVSPQYDHCPRIIQ